MSDDAEFVSLFSGVGGLDLAVEAVFGTRPTLFCEADPYCRAILRREWPDVPCAQDVATLELRSCAGASLAKTSATPDSEPDSKAIDPASGWRWRGAFAIYDPPSSSWRTSAGSLFEASTKYSETFPASGTMRSGRLFERQTLAPLSSDPASSSSPYGAPYPTPSATPCGSLGTWPTPVTTDDKGSGRHSTTTGIMHPGTSLTDAMLIHQGQDRLRGPDGTVLNPEFVEALMGLPPQWTLVDDDTASSCLETEWCRTRLGMRSRDSSSELSTTD